MKQGFLVCCVCLALTGCNVGESRRDHFKEVGVLGEHQLKKIESFDSITGKIQGRFLLGGGHVEGEVTGERMLQFYWEPQKNTIISTSFPYSKFSFVVDETKLIPTVEFQFAEWFLNQRVEGLPNDTAPRWIKDPNINHYVMTNPCMELVVIRLTRATLENEIFRPKKAP